MTYWPWILLSQKSPLPEKYLLGAPDAVFGNPFGQGSLGEAIKSEYLETYRDPGKGSCHLRGIPRSGKHRHRARSKRTLRTAKKIKSPMLHLWAEGGPLDTFYERDGGALGIWRKWAEHLQGQAMKGGHFFRRRIPTTKVLREFLTS